MSAMIIGNVVGAQIITRTSGAIFFGIMWLIMMTGVFGFCFVTVPEEHEEEELGSLKTPEKKPSFWKELANTLKLMFTKKFLYLDL